MFALAFVAIWALLQKRPAVLELALHLKGRWQEARLRASHTAMQKLGRYGIGVWRMFAWESAPRGRARPARRF